MSDRVFLIIRAPNGDVREVPLGTSTIVIGRDESADIRVDDKKVSRRHAAFVVEDGVPWVLDLGSANGVRLNGEKIDKRARLGPQDKVRVGGFYVALKPTEPAVSGSVADRDRPAEPASLAGDVARTRPAKVVERPAPAVEEDLPRLIGRDEPARGRVFVLHRGENIVGRLEECDVPILDGSVSRQHARLVFARDRVTVTDLGSSNGISVNDVRVDMAELAHGDVLKIGNVSFDVRLPQLLAGRAVGPVETRARPKAVATAGGRRWLSLGLAGLISAAAVAGGALYYLRSRGSLPGAAGKLLALADPPADAGAAAPEDPAVAPAPVDPGTADPTAPPPAAPPPAAPPPAAPPPAVAPPPAAPPAAAPSPATPTLASVRTATSPYTRRDALGLPMNLPPVPPDFDFDAFVAEKLGAARVCKEAGDYSCLKERLAELLARDPINADARVLGAEAERYAQAKAALAQADRHMAKGEFARAYRVLAEIPDDAPQVAEARARAQEIKAQAVEDELARARQDATRRARWPRAHQRYLKVLELEPGSEEAVAGVRELERKMRRKNVEFVPYEPPAAGAGEGSGVTDLKSLNAAILAHYGGDRDLAKVAQAYARGAVAKAKRTAAKLAASGPAKTRRRAAQQEELIGDVERRYARTRTEISNDPDRAWSMLMQLQKREKELLPDSVTSFLCRELEVSLSEAFAERGASMFDRGRFEEAFQGWVSGYKLDSTNPKVRAGLERLERKAETLSQEAELAGQRGDPGACDKWKQVTRITRAETEVHTKARERALALCR